jgi:AraC-like DNA-binding protein
MSEQNEYHYLPVDDRAVQWGFYLTTAGRVLDAVAKNMPYGVHPDMYMFDLSLAPSDAIFTSSPRESGRILPEFVAILITDTHAVFESDETGVIEFQGPTLLFLFPGVWHRYRPVGSDKRWLTSRWIGFNGDIAYRLMNQQSITPETACRTVARARRLAAAFDRLIDRVATNTAADAMLLSMRGMDLLADCVESTSMSDVKDTATQEPQQVDHGSEALTARMLDLIWTGSHRELTIEQMCESVGAKRRNMERWFTAARGHSLRAEVNLCRCRRAQHFLETTDLPIKNVCWLAGFLNPDQMRVNFLHVVGMLPDQYRQTHRRERR